MTWVSTLMTLLMYGSISTKTLTEQCPDCMGQGSYMVEHPVVDYADGGYLEEKEETCIECQGRGMI